MQNFNHLTQSENTVSATPPSGFDPEIALILGNACNLTYMQYASDKTTLPEAMIQQAMGTKGKFIQIAEGFSTSENIAMGSNSEAGNYRTVPMGFAMQYTPADNTGGFNIIAIRGTRTYQEWIDDAEVIPSYWHIGNNNNHYYDELTLTGLGMVHGGFYNLYNVGIDGAKPVKSYHDIHMKYEYSRPEGSLSAFVAKACAALDSSLPLYITGHSLGAALAVICAMDVGVNFPKSFAKGQLNMWNLAGPLVASGINIETLLLSPSVFVNNYAKYVNSSFRIVNAADLVPIVPPEEIGTTDFSLKFAHVTKNTVTYCNQTGSIGGNHSCTDNYQPYLNDLAGGFSAKQ